MRTPEVRDTIVELDDQPSEPPRRRADRVVIAGLLTASVVFGAGVWIARPAVDSRVTVPAATVTPPTSATAKPRTTAAASGTPYRPTTSLVPIGNGVVVIDRPTADAVILRWISATDGERWMSLH